MLGFAYTCHTAFLQNQYYIMLIIYYLLLLLLLLLLLVRLLQLKYFYHFIAIVFISTYSSINVIICVIDLNLFI